MFLKIGNYLTALLTVLTCLFVSFPTVADQNAQAVKENLVLQSQRIEELSQLYSSDNFVAVDESKATGIDVSQLYRSGVKFNELSFVGTHNSYQLQSVPAYREFMEALSTVSFGKYSSEKFYYFADTLTEQFNLGIRSIELDIETVVKNGKVSFVCCHSPVIDSTSTCYDLALALKEIKMWSDANGNHLPITVIIEPKKIFFPEKDMRLFTVSYAKEFEKLLEKTFGESLVTPADVMGSYDSLKQMREADAWPTAEQLKGKIMFLLHDTTITQNYIALDKTIKTQKMFPMLRYADRDKSYASFLLVNKADEAVEKSKELVDKKRLIIRTRADSYGDVDEKITEECYESSAQIISTDYPKKAGVSKDKRVVCFENGATVRVVK